MLFTYILAAHISVRYNVDDKHRQSWPAVAPSYAITIITVYQVIFKSEVTVGFNRLYNNIT